MGAPTQARGLTYADLERFPDDRYRREIIGGELFVSAAPRPRHQDVVGELYYRLRAHVDDHGGKVYVAPLDVYFAEDTVVEPDVLYLAPERLGRIEERVVRGAPDLVAEVSSPSTRHLELVRKKALYEREGVREYFYVDLDADRVEVYRLARDGYGQPELLGRDATLRSPLLPGFAVPVDDLLGSAPDAQA